MTICTRCSQAIANVHLYRGKPYGPDCIEAVTGRKADCWVSRREAGVTVLDEEATARKDQAEKDRKDRVALHKQVYGAENRGDTTVTCLVCKETRCHWSEVGFKNSDGRCYYCGEEKRSLTTA